MFSFTDEGCKLPFLRQTTDRFGMFRRRCKIRRRRRVFIHRRKESRQDLFPFWTLAKIIVWVATLRNVGVFDAAFSVDNSLVCVNQARNNYRVPMIPRLSPTPFEMTSISQFVALIIILHRKFFLLFFIPKWKMNLRRKSQS